MLEIRSHRAEVDGAEVHAVVDRVIQLLSPLGDDHCLARAWHLKAEAANLEGGASALTEEFSLKALWHARADGDGRLEFDAATYQCFSWALGPTPAEQALALCEELHAATETRLAKATIYGSSGYVLAIAGRLDEGWQRNSEARRFFLDVETFSPTPAPPGVQGLIETWNDDLAAAEQTMREGCEILEEVGENAWRSTSLIHLADVHLLLGDLERAEAMALEGRRIGTDDDVVNELWSRLALAPVHAARGELTSRKRSRAKRSRSRHRCIHPRIREKPG